MQTINDAPLGFWKGRDASAEQIMRICQTLDTKCMFALVRIDNAQVQVTISRRTMERQEGHFPAVSRYFADVARHPRLASKSGAFLVWLEDGLWEWDLDMCKEVPVLSFGRTRNNSFAFVIPDPAFMDSRGYIEDLAEIHSAESALEWEKKFPTIFWRGAATGVGIESPAWKQTIRGNLALFAKKINNDSVLNAKITKVSHLPLPQQEEMLRHDILGDPVPFLDFLQYRYLIDADGYSWAWMSLFLKLATSSTVLRIESDYDHWFSDQLIPWKNFLPLSRSLDSFPNVHDWLQHNDQEARSIALNANALISSLTYENTIETTALLCEEVLGF